MINIKTGEETVLDTGVIRSVNFLENCDSDILSGIDITNSYKFECNLHIPGDPDYIIRDFFTETWQWKLANRYSEQLNDYIEEFHAPGTNRKERRLLKRLFAKTYAQFKRHCHLYGIEYKFVDLRSNGK